MLAAGLATAAISAPAFAAPAAGPVTTDVTVPGPVGPLAGTLTIAAPKAPVVVIIPGSGPTNRDGNNPLGVKGQPYKLLAQALAARGISTLRADKRGMFGSKGALADPNAVTIADYVADTRAWAALAAKRSGVKCAWLAGHSEGGVIAMATAAQNPKGICGVALLAAPGRKLDAVIHDQLSANTASADLLPDADRALASLSAGKTVDPATLPAPLRGLFASKTQPFLIDMIHYDPPTLIAKIKLPVVIIQGDNDLQIKMIDADALAAADPRASRVTVPHMNHVLKIVTSNDVSANIKAYADPNLPVAPALVDAVANFVTAKR